MPRIEIGAGIVLAVLAPLGLLGYLPVAVVLLLFGVFLILHGSYDEFVKPHYHVERRLKGWFLRRDWSVQLERTAGVTFRLNLNSASSNYRVTVIREKRARNDFISFTGLVPLHPDWLETLDEFTAAEREVLVSEVRIYLTGKDMSYELLKLPTGELVWPPQIAVQTAIPQDHTLSQHSSDMAAKTVELSMIGTRDVIRKAVANHASSRGSTDAKAESPLQEA